MQRARTRGPTRGEECLYIPLSLGRLFSLEIRPESQIYSEKIKKFIWDGGRSSGTYDIACLITTGCRALSHSLKTLNAHPQPPSRKYQALMVIDGHAVSAGFSHELIHQSIFAPTIERPRASPLFSVICTCEHRSR